MSRNEDFILQPSSTTPGNGLRIVEAKADVKPGRVCSILKQKREISLNIVITFGNKTFFITQCGN